MINRLLEPILKIRLFKRKVLVVLGPRQSGKTTLIQNLVMTTGIDYKWFNGDEPDVRHILSNSTSTQLKSLIGDFRMVIIDEAQRIKNIGLTLKLLHDNFPEIQVIATGSSSFELANKINEPLTGRKWEYNLFPLSARELIIHFGKLEEERLLEDRLIFGSYPEIVSNSGEKRDLLQQLADSYLYKDILTWENLKKPGKLDDLLRALAWQIGSEVSYSELGNICSLDNETVEKYIDLLEKAFIVFRLGSFSRNLRNELKKSRKIYFYDLGIRNSIINNFNPISMRNDVGALWENYLVAERIKYTHYAGIYSNRYFWRTHQQREIDYIEERDGALFAWEFKWGSIKNVKIPLAFKNAYKESVFEVITRDNYHNFIGFRE